MAALATALLAISSIAGNVLATPGTVEMKFGRVTPRVKTVKRDPAAVTVGNLEQYGLYYVNATVGTPGQTVVLQIDTGSSDVWMFDRSACASAQCLGGYYFDPSESSSYSLLLADAFQIQYVTPGSGVEGDYISDVFALGGLKITNQTMALATQAKQVNTGIMGIGFDTDESLVAQGNAPYPSIIDEMVNQGLIESHAYSLWLDDQEASSGTVLFGGYDTEKYYGELTVLDIQPDVQSGTISSFTVVWSLLALTDSTGTTAVAVDSFPYAAVLDSGTTLMAVPQEVYDPIAGYFGVEESETYGSVFRCKYGAWEGTLDFGFGGENGAIIQVPFSELAIPTTDEDGNPLKFRNGDEACAFGIQVTPQEGTFLLGDTLLRSAYVVYDIDAQQIGIAQTVWNATKSNIKAIGTGSKLQNLIPSASYASDSVKVTQVASDVSIEPGNGYTFTNTDVEESSATATGTLSYVSGVKTTLDVPSLTATPYAGAITGGSGSASSSRSGFGGSGSSASTSAATSTSAAAAAVFATSVDRGIVYTLATVVVMMAGGAVMFAQF